MHSLRTESTCATPSGPRFCPAWTQLGWCAQPVQGAIDTADTRSNSITDLGCTKAPPRQRGPMSVLFTADNKQHDHGSSWMNRCMAFPSPQSATASRIACIRALILQHLDAASLVAATNVERAHACQFGQFTNLIGGSLRVTQPNHLCLPLVPRFARQRPLACCLHAPERSDRQNDSVLAQGRPDAHGPSHKPSSQRRAPDTVP